MKPMPGAIASQFGRLARSANNAPPLHVLAGIGAVLAALTVVTPFAFEAFGDNAFIALSIAVFLLVLIDRLSVRVNSSAAVPKQWDHRLVI
jgi:hypothetical protein